jgi:hypothetical protein
MDTDVLRNKIMKNLTEAVVAVRPVTQCDDSLCAKSDLLPGGLADNKKVSDIALHHGVPVDFISRQLSAGIEVEMEHTNDRNKATEIALDHLWELPDYYDRLQAIEPMHESIDLEDLQLMPTNKWINTVKQLNMDLLDPEEREELTQQAQEVAFEMRRKAQAATTAGQARKAFNVVEWLVDTFGVD